MSKFIFVLLVAPVFSFAGEGHHHDHREHGAHVHGEASLSIAFEGTKGKIELETPAGNIVGFEHKAKTPKDKATVAKALETLKVGSQVFEFKDMGCEISKANVEQKFDGSHSEIEAQWDVQCNKALAGQKMEILLGKVFAGVKALKVEILVDDLQKQQELKGGQGLIEFKK